MAEVNRIVVGDVTKAGVYMGAVIDQKAFTSITGAIQRAADDDGCEIVTGGTWDDSTGWFIQPTTIVCSDPMYETMQVELFGPVLSIHVYEDADFERMIGVVDNTSEYALTGSIFATDRRHVETAMLAFATPRELLHQRQAHRRCCRSAAFRRCTWKRHQRQG